MQRAELDRDAVVVLHRLAPASPRARDGGDRVLVVREVALRVVRGARAFAEHVVGEAQLRLARGARRPLRRMRLGDRLPQHELAAQQLHGAQGGGDHGARAQPRRTGRLRAAPVARAGSAWTARSRCATGAPAALSADAFEVGARKLVGREGDRGLGIGHAQQRLGQPHQGQAFGAGDRVFLQQAFHRPERRRMAAHGIHPGPARPARRPRPSPARPAATAGGAATTAASGR